MDGTSTHCITQHPVSVCRLPSLPNSPQYQPTIDHKSVMPASAKHSIYINSQLLMQRSCADIMIVILMPICKNAARRIQEFKHIALMLRDALDG